MKQTLTISITRSRDPSHYWIPFRVLTDPMFLLLFWNRNIQVRDFVVGAWARRFQELGFVSSIWYLFVALIQHRFLEFEFVAWVHWWQIGIRTIVSPKEVSFRAESLAIGGKDCRVSVIKGKRHVQRPRLNEIPVTMASIHHWDRPGMDRFYQIFWMQPEESNF